MFAGLGATNKRLLLESISLLPFSMNNKGNKCWRWKRKVMDIPATLMRSYTSPRGRPYSWINDGGRENPCRATARPRPCELVIGLARVAFDRSSFSPRMKSFALIAPSGQCWTSFQFGTHAHKRVRIAKHEAADLHCEERTRVRRWMEGQPRHWYSRLGRMSNMCAYD